MLRDHGILLLALGFLAMAAIRLGRKGAWISPHFLAATAFIVIGLLNIFPQLYYTSRRSYILGLETQWLLFVSAVAFFVAALFIRSPQPRGSTFNARWRWLPLRGWLVVAFVFCAADPIVTVALHGRVGLVAGNMGMGLGGGAHTQVFTPLTYIAWAWAGIATVMVVTDRLFSGESGRRYFRRHAVDFLLLAFCLALTSLSGNRFVIISAAASALMGWAVFGRLRARAVLVFVPVLVVFFVAVGEFRFGAIDIATNLRTEPSVKAWRAVVAWGASYLEPVLPNLDSLVRNRPAPQLGIAWLSSVMPSGIVEALNIPRMNAAQWLTNRSLYVYHGLTFRTMYADLVLDFGLFGAIVVGAVFYGLGAVFYNRAVRSPRWFATFLVFGTLILWSPLLAGFYGIQNIALFAVVPLLKGARQPFVPVREACAGWQRDD